MTVPITFYLFGDYKDSVMKYGNCFARMSVLQLKKYSKKMTKQMAELTSPPKPAEMSSLCLATRTIKAASGNSSAMMNSLISFRHCHHGHHAHPFKQILNFVPVPVLAFPAIQLYYHLVN